MRGAVTATPAATNAHPAARVVDSAAFTTVVVAAIAANKDAADGGGDAPERSRSRDA